MNSILFKRVTKDNPLQLKLAHSGNVGREDRYSLWKHINIYLIRLLKLFLILSSVIRTISVSDNLAELGQIAFWFIIPILLIIKMLKNNKLSFWCLFSIFVLVNINSVHSTAFDLEAAYTEEHVTSNCTVEFPDKTTKIASTFDITKAFAWSVIDIIGLATGPFGAVAASGLHFIEAMKLLEDGASDDEYNQRIQKAFEVSWKCTQDYIDRQIQHGRLHSMRAEQENIKGKISDVTLAMNIMTNKTSDINKTSSFEGYASDEINDLVDIFKDMNLDTGTETEETPLRCRVYMNELMITITAMNSAFSQYTRASGSDTNTIDQFKANLADVLVMFRDCASFALYDILSNSNGKTLNEFTSELSIIYDGDIFCEWVEFAYENVFHSYQFAGNNFYEWNIYACNSIKWILFVNDRLMDYDSSRFDAYEMTTAEFWSDLSRENNIIYSQRTYGEETCNLCRNCKPYCSLSSSATYESCSESWLSEGDATYSKYEWEYATVTKTDDKNAKFMFMGCNTETSSDKCGTIYSGTTNFATKTQSCPDGSHFTGGRYFVYDPLWDEGIGIGGLHLICSNENDYGNVQEYYNTDYATSFELYSIQNSIHDQHYWSPWFICPIGYYLDLKIIAINGCTDSYYRCMNCDGIPYGYRYNELTTITSDQKVIFKCVKTDLHPLGIIKLEDPASQYDQLCLSRSSNANNDVVGLSECDPTSELQQFYVLSHQFKTINGKCLEYNEYDEVAISTCNFDNNHTWIKESDYTLTNSGQIMTSNGKCLKASRFAIDQNTYVVGADLSSSCDVATNWGIYPSNLWSIQPLIDIQWQTIHTNLYNQDQIETASDGTAYTIGNYNYIWKLQGNNWIQQSYKALSIAVATNGRYWYVTENGRVYSVIDGTRTWMGCSGGNGGYGACFTQISVSDDGNTLYGVNTDNEVVKRNFQNGQWISVQTSRTQVAVGSSSNIWYLTSNGRAFEGYAWRGCSGGWGGYGACFKQLSVGSDGTVFGINTDNEIFYYQMDNNLWRQVDGSYKYVSVVNKDIVWVTSGNNIYQANDVQAVIDATSYL